MTHRTETLFGLDFFKGSLEDAVNAVSRWEANRSTAIPLIVTPNTDIVVQFDRLRKKDPAFVQRLEQSAFMLPDGFPVLIASRLRKRPLPGVVPGADLLPSLVEHTRGKRFLFVGPDERTLAILAGKIESETDHRTQWVAPPMMETGSPVFREQAKHVSEMIQTFNPDFVVVCLGFPKQERFSLAVMDQLPSNTPLPLFMGLGASAEFMAGTKKRAPRWMRSLHLEWMHRLLSEPRRMFRRYAGGAIRILPILFREWRH